MYKCGTRSTGPPIMVSKSHPLKNLTRMLFFLKLRSCCITSECSSILMRLWTEMLATLGPRGGRTGLTFGELWY